MQTSLSEKITAIMAELRRLGYDGKNTQQHYEYVSSDKVLQEVGRQMAAKGVVIVPGVTGTEITPFTYSGSKTGFDAVVTLNMAVTDGNEASFSTLWVGAGRDYTAPDKAVYKAITSGHKYFLNKLFCIGAGNEDSEHEPPPPATEQKRKIIDVTPGGSVVTQVSGTPAAVEREIMKSLDRKELDLVEGGNGSNDGPPSDMHAWIEDKATPSETNGSVVGWGMVADALVMTGKYNDRQHVKNAFKKDRNFLLDFRMNAPLAKALKAYDWAMERKEVTE